MFVLDGRSKYHQRFRCTYLVPGQQWQFRACFWQFSITSNVSRSPTWFIAMLFYLLQTAKRGVGCWMHKKSAKLARNNDIFLYLLHIKNMMYDRYFLFFTPYVPTDLLTWDGLRTDGT